MNKNLQLSVLDQSPIPDGKTSGDALRNTIDLARRAEQFGYSRFWIAEHHGTPGLASASPEVMIGPVASATQHIHVGTGGVMLPHYSPLKVAETFSMLSSLYPDRIDLGIGRAPGTSARVAFALQRDRRQPAPDDFPDQMAELFHYFHHRPGQTDPAAPDPRANPFRQAPNLHYHSPQLGLLGSSPQSALWAAEWGLPYIFADFINPKGAPMAAIYREHFVPSSAIDKPRTSVCVWALCADTAEEALHLSASARMMLLHLFRGRLIRVPPVDRALAYLDTEGVPINQVPEGRRIITGDPATVKEAIQDVAVEYGADEVFLVNIVYDHEARVRSYQLIAEAFGLTNPSTETIHVEQR